jgi:hypothetical protein
MIDEFFIHDLITERINKFHDALVERGQIKPLQPQRIAHEHRASRCKEGRWLKSGQTQSVDETAH